MHVFNVTKQLKLQLMVKWSTITRLVTISTTKRIKRN